MLIKILSFDTTTEMCSIALMIDNFIVKQFSIRTNRGHLQKILPMIDLMLNKFELKLHDLDFIVYGRGPGSFTGIRIGIGIAHGLSIGSNVPIVGISSFETLAQGSWRKTGAQQALIIIDANVKKIYWSYFLRKKDGTWLDPKNKIFSNTSEILKLTSSLFGVWSFVGSGWEKYPNLKNKISNDHLFLYSGKTIFPEAQDMISLVFKKLTNGTLRKLNEINPIYI